MCERHTDIRCTATPHPLHQEAGGILRLPTLAGRKPRLFISFCLFFLHCFKFVVLKAALTIHPSIRLSVHPSVHLSITTGRRGGSGWECVCLCVGCPTFFFLIIFFRHSSWTQTRGPFTAAMLRPPSVVLPSEKEEAEQKRQRVRKERRRRKPQLMVIKTF